MQDQIFENGNIQDFIECFEDFGPNIGHYSCLNEIMKICIYKRSSSFFDL